MLTRQGSIVTVPSGADPISVADAKVHLRIEQADTDQDGFVAQLCAAAHRKVENELDYPILRQTRQTHLRGFPEAEIDLGGGNDFQVASVDYYDADGVQQTLATSAYILDAVSKPAKLYPAPNTLWPATQDRPGAVIVEWQSGWAAPGDVPPDLLHAMRLLIGHWDQNREAVVIGSISTDVQFTFDALIWPFRIYHM
jgi:uncharacterized phiE125 gp8 family phage protein